MKQKLPAMVDDAAAGQFVEGVRQRVQQEEDKVLLDNALKTTSSIRTSGQPFFREPVIGGGLLLLGTVWALATLVMAMLENTPARLAQTAGSVLFGMVFAFVGYWSLAYRDTFQVEPRTRQWRHIKGAFPFCGRRSGLLSTAKGVYVGRETRTAGGVRAHWSYEVWSTQIVWQDSAQPPLILYALDLPVNDVERDTAMHLYKWYGTLIGLTVADGE